MENIERRGDGRGLEGRDGEKKIFGTNRVELNSLLGRLEQILK
jgi:hypothetical protein